MAKRYSGELVIEVHCTDRWDSAGRMEYAGSIRASNGQTWKFDELYVHAKGASDSPESYDRAAKTALGFASYYTTDNRDPDDLPAWTPLAELADAFETEGDCGDDVDGTRVFRSRKAQNAQWAKDAAKRKEEAMQQLALSK